MTRKEVCKATGLSVKTLRLYEEKGLISPQKEYRNGREYREYTPELAEELLKIATLRRAQFTMEEIKTMQAQPEKIPAIFQSYRLWLGQQEQRLHRLRLAAEAIDPENLTSLEGLIDGLGSTAEEMPLPAMDIQPNFKRLDEMEETRLVQPQTNLDDMVPGDRVFRQMNLVMDRDKANNINIAFGQVNDMRREKNIPVESGPVQRVRTVPKWQKITGGILTALLVLCFLYMFYEALMFRAFQDPWLWVCFIVLLLARIALYAVPVYLDHRKWLKKAQQEDAARQGEDMEGYRREEQKRRKKIQKIAVLVIAGCVVLAAVIFGLYKLIDSQVNATPDYTVCILVPGRLSDQDIYKFETAIAPMVGDLDGNGKETVKMDQYRQEISRGAIGNTGGGDMTEWFNNANLRKNEDYPIFFVANFSYGHYLNLCEELRFDKYCRELPEDIASPENSYLADLGGAKIFKDAGLEAMPLCACIANYTTEEEYTFAVEVIRKILAE